MNFFPERQESGSITPSPAGGRGQGEGSFLIVLFRALTALWVLAVFASHLWYYRTNTAPPSWDDAWYLEYSFRFYHELAHGHLRTLAVEYIHSFLIKAPLISVLPLPFYFIFGPSVHSALLVNAAGIVILLLAIYGIGRELNGESAGLAAVWICSLMPLLYGLPRYFLVETTLAAAVAVTLYFLIRSLPEGRSAPAVPLGLCIGLGLLLKSLYLLFMVGPFIYYWKLKSKEPGQRAETARSFKIMLAVGLGLASTWYAFNWLTAFGFAVRAGFGDIAKHYGSRFLSLSALEHYWIETAFSAVGWPLLILGLLAVLGDRYISQRPEPVTRKSTWTLLWATFPPFLVFLAGINKDVRYLAPLLPPLAAWIGLSVSRLCEKSVLRWAGVVAFLAFAGQTFIHQTFGSGSEPALSYNGPPSHREDWGQDRIVDRLNELAQGRSVTAAVAVEHPAFNANNLAMWSALKDYSITFISLGYAQNSVEAALIRLKERNASYILLADGLPPGELPPFLNQINLLLRQRLDAEKLPYRKLEQIPLVPPVTITVFARSF